MLSEAQKENVNQEGERKKEFSKRKKDERKKSLHEVKYRAHVIYSSGAGTTLKEETFAVSRFLAKSAKVYSRKIFQKTSSAKVSSREIF